MQVLVQVIRWINDYQATLQDLGIEEEETRFPTKEQSGMALLIDQYIRRMQTTRQTWSKNILEVRAAALHEPGQPTADAAACQE